MGGPEIDAAAGSAVGARYDENYDVTWLRPDPLLAVVADGMGAGVGSATAGRTAVDTFVEALAGTTRPDPTAVFEAVAAAQERVGRAGRSLGVLTGCTLTALLAAPGGALMVQIGDSRVYRWRAGLLELLTVDHTLAWLGAVHGWYPFDSPQAASARYRLTRYIGHPNVPEPDVSVVRMRSGDRYLLCTDGISDQLDYHTVAGVLADSGSARSAVDRLVLAADLAGGDDNASAVVVDVR